MRSMPGPAATWIEEDEAEEVALSYLITRAQGILATRLERRLALLQDDTVNIDRVLAEIKRQIADCAVDGDVLGTSDLSDLAADLLMTRENLRTL